MGGELNRHAAPAGAALAMVAALALAGCGSTSTSSLLTTSPLDLFKTSSKATATDANAAAGAPEADTDIECPGVQVRNGASTLIIGSKPGQAEPAALDIRYQGSLIRTARECHVANGVMTMKVGIEGRVITGPAGGPGTVDVPLRIAVVQEGVAPKTITSKFGKESVTVSADVDRVTFTHIEPDISFPLPQPAGNIDSYVIYVGFDPLGAPPEKKRPPAKRKSAAKPKQS
ncbi:MAG TPA: hypothetical protein VI251_18775 [Pseudolabrys sp.]